jgi:opacity protein-like surface antigen
MKKSLILASLLLATSAIANQSYQTGGFSITSTSGDFESSTSSKSFSLNRNFFEYNLYNPNYIIKASYGIMPEQTLYSTKTSNNNPYDYKRKASGFGVTYIHKIYQKDKIYIAPIIKLSRIKSEGYAHLTNGAHWIATGTADSVTTSRTDTDLSLDIMIAKEYKEYSTAYAVLSLVDDLIFKDDDDDERSNFTLTVGAEHYLQDNWRLIGSFSKYLTDKKADSKWSATKNVTSINIGVDYKF